ncbi:MAG: right-handed parallel beta-helix repeat-containing protein, partial [Thermoplasmata archaeon]|nr:right-handed parallel beta-helix repeat-containing protein [Thermoplasmata archaeon]
MVMASQEGEALSDHGTIYIGSDNGFTSAKGVRSGSGTLADPYIISDWRINCTTANGIEIRQTTKHFIVRNITAQRIGGGMEAIYLDHVTNGTFSNFTILGGVTHITVRIFWSENISIENLTTPEGSGTWHWGSTNCAVRGVVTGNLYTYISSHILFENCTTSDRGSRAMQIDRCDNITVANCTLPGIRTGIDMYGSATKD